MFQLFVMSILLAGGALFALFLISAWVISKYYLPAKHSFTRSMTIDRPAAEVWKLNCNLEDQTAWRTFLKSVERSKESANTFVQTFHKGEKMTVKVLERNDSKFELTQDLDDGKVFKGKWFITVTPKTPAAPNNGVSDSCSCTVTIREEGTMCGVFTRLVGYLLMKPDYFAVEYLHQLHDYVTTNNKKQQQQQQQQQRGVESLTASSSTSSTNTTTATKRK